MFGHLWGATVTTVCQKYDSRVPEAGNDGLRALKRAGAIVLVAGLAACSTAPDWARSGMIYGDDAEAASAGPSEERDFPELSDVPEKPAAITSEEERRRAAEGLAADRERARYTDEILRGGTEAPAPAPQSANPVPTPIASSTIVAPAAAADVSAASDAGVIPEPSRGGRPLPSASAATQAQAPQARAAETPAVAVMAVEPAAPAPAPAAEPAAPVRESRTAPAAKPEMRSAAAPEPVPAQTARTSRRPAVPPVEGDSMASRARPATMVDERIEPVNAAAAAVAAAPAKVPAPAPVQKPAQARASDRFEASSAPVLAQEALEAAGPVVSSRYGVPGAVETGDADPEAAVQVNMDAILGVPGPGAALVPSNGAETNAAYANQGGPGNIPPYVVNFGHGSVHLSAADRQKISQAADAAATHGGVVRVIGHASSRTSDLAIGEHLLANFRVSLDRATAVANELIRNGVDPARVFVEAKGDAVPVYYESMPAGEAGNRRAEIFIE